VKEWKISDSQKQHFTTNLVAGEIQEDQLKDGQTSEHRNRKSQKKKKSESVKWIKLAQNSVVVGSREHGSE
jgi:hypothetical protein